MCIFQFEWRANRANLDLMTQRRWRDSLCDVYELRLQLNTKRTVSFLPIITAKIISLELKLLLCFLSECDSTGLRKRRTRILYNILQSFTYNKLKKKRKKKKIIIFFFILTKVEHLVALFVFKKTLTVCSWHLIFKSGL